MNIVIEYNLKTGEYCVDGSCYMFDTQEYSVAIMSNLQQNELESIRQSFSQSFIEMFKHITGQFSAFVYDKKTSELTCFQDILGGLTPVYFTKNNDKLYLSTSLKKLLYVSQVPRELNKTAEKEFLIYATTFGSKTLIKNVFKLPLQKMLVVSAGNYQLLNNAYTVEEKMTSKEGQVRWENTMKNAIVRCVPESVKDKGIAMPLSAGFDSNFILYNLATYTDNKIDCFTVGGARGVSEISNVEKITKCYGQNVSCNTAVVSSQTFQSFPDIVWRLEGCMYETGVFLQYELSKKMNANSVIDIVCGEGSDEVFIGSFYDNITCPKETFSPTKERHGDKYTWLAQFVSKKSAIMMNSFGITPRYPYTDRNVLSIAEAVKDVNGAGDKAFHKDFCRKHIPAEVLENMKTMGGSTDVLSFFDGEPITEFKKMTNGKINSNFYPSVSMINFYISFRILISKILKRQKSGITAWKYNRFNDKYITRLYLELFKRLFISGKYDSEFNNNSFNISLNELLK